MTDSQPPKDSAEALARLREILVGPEREQLVELREELDDSALDAEEIAALLPTALRQTDEVALAEVLAPTIEQSIGVSVQRNPKPLTDAIFPLMGPAIRRSIREALAGLTESINRTLEHSLSPRGLSWRLEALRTGVPFSQIVLQKSLVFRVEQVFLIHRETGLLLEHVVAPGPETGDPEVVSAMLLAIADFVSDSFDPGQKAELSQVQFGDRVLQVATGPRAVIACEVFGVLTHELRVQISEVLEGIHAQFGAALEQFDGDPSAFFAARAQLSSLLIEERPVAAERGAKRRWWPALVAIALLLWGVRAAVVGWYEARRWGQLEAALEAEPGIVLVRSDESGGQHRLIGLRDPLAIDPLELVVEAGLEPSDVVATWTPFVSLEPELVRKRTLASLGLFGDLRASWDGLKLKLVGSAPSSWTQSARQRFELGGLPGLEALDTSALVDPSWSAGPH